MLIFIAADNSFDTVSFTMLTLTDQSLRASVACRRDEPRPLVKAVTYHRLGLWYDGGVWHARLIVDV